MYHGIERKIGLEEALGRVEIKPEGYLPRLASLTPLDSDDEKSATEISICLCE